MLEDFFLGFEIVVIGGSERLAAALFLEGDGVLFGDLAEEEGEDAAGLVEEVGGAGVVVVVAVGVGVGRGSMAGVAGRVTAGWWSSSVVVIITSVLPVAAAVASVVIPTGTSLPLLQCQKWMNLR